MTLRGVTALSARIEAREFSRLIERGARGIVGVSGVSPDLNQMR